MRRHAIVFGLSKPLAVVVGVLAYARARPNQDLRKKCRHFALVFERRLLSDACEVVL